MVCDQDRIRRNLCNREKEVVIYFDIKPRYLSEETEQNHETPHTGQSAS